MKFFKNKKTNKSIFKAIPLFGVFVILFLLVFNFCSAADTFGVKSAFEGMIRGLFYAIFSITMVFFNLARWLLNLMLSAEVYEKVFFSPMAITAIKETWAVVRDFFNIFFMLIILLVAIGTILQVQRFSDKKMILNVIVAALLVNFSLPIALFIIDISQLAMTFFASGINTDGLAFADNISNQIKAWRPLDSTFTDFTSYVVTIVFTVIFFLMFSGILIILAAALLIRVIAFWVLLILSPLAMFGIALKGTGLGLESATGDWFKKMSYYSFFGPILLFFLWIALHLITVVSKLMLTSGFTSEFNVESISLSKDGVGGFAIGALSIFIPFFVTLYLLYYGYDLAQKSAAGSTQKLMNWGSKKADEWGRKAGKASLVMGTLGAAPYVASHGKALYRARKEQLEGTSFARVLTKKGREDMQKERDARYQTRIVDGKTRKEANREVELKKNREEANKLRKEWKEMGMPKEDELKKLLKSGSSSERVAAAQELASMGKLGKEGEENYYTMAQEAVGDDERLKNELQNTAKGKNKWSIMQHTIKNDPVKARAEALKYVSAQEEARLIKDEKLEGAKLEEKMNEFRRTYEENTSPDAIERDYLHSQFQTMTMKDFIDQDKDMQRSAYFKEYINKRREESPVFQEKIDKFFINHDQSSPEKMAIWEANGFLSKEVVETDSEKKERVKAQEAAEAAKKEKEESDRWRTEFMRK